MNRHFTEESTQMMNKHMKGCSISLIIRGLQFKTTMRYHYAPVRRGKIKNNDVNGKH